MQCKIINFDWLKNFPEVTTPKIFNRNKFHKEGLFSEVIFPPTEPYQFAHIKVSESPILIHPIFLILFSKLSGIDEELIIDVLTGTQYVTINNNNTLLFTNEPVNETSAIGVNGVELIIEHVRQKNAYAKQFIDSLPPDTIFTNVIPVYPPVLRPLVRLDTSKICLHAINNIYMQILCEVQALKQAFPGTKLYQTLHKRIQEDFLKLVDAAMKLLSGKVGLIRRHIIGKRVDFSGRAVIVVNPELSLVEAEIPYKIADMLSITFLRDLSIALQKSPIDIIEHMHSDKAIDQVIKNELDKVVSGLPVILNRQPTLHKQSIMAFYTKLIDADVVRIPALCTDPYNADFDGDQMAVYYPILSTTRQEVENTLLIDKNLIAPSNNKFTPIAKHDVVMGLYQITRALPDANDIKEKFDSLDSALSYIKSVKDVNYFETIAIQHNNEQIVTTKGWLKVLSIFPNEFIEKVITCSFFNKPLTKNAVNQFFEYIYFNAPTNERIKYIDTLTQLGFKSVAVTLSIDDFNLNIDKELKDNFFKTLTDTTHENFIKAFKEECQNKLNKGDHVKNSVLIITSGSRGNWDQFKACAIGKGYIADSRNRIVPLPIKHSLLEGLTEKEFFLSAYGGMKGLVDTSTRTSMSGYLTRQLVYLLQSACLNTFDCRTPLTVELTVTSDIAPLIENRYIVTENGTYKKIINGSEYIGKTIQLRSPIFCRAQNGFCHICYGDTLQKTPYIGIIAAQTIGERTTQLTLRTFHTSGIVNIAELPEEFYLDNFNLMANTDIVFHDNNRYTANGKIYNLNERLESKFDILKPVQKGTYPKGSVITQVSPIAQDIINDITKFKRLLEMKMDEQMPFEFTKDCLSIFKHVSSASLVHYELITAHLFFDQHNQNEYFRYTATSNYDVGYKKSIKTAILSKPNQALTFENIRNVILDLVLKSQLNEVITDATQSIFSGLLAGKVKKDTTIHPNMLTDISTDVNDMFSEEE